MKKYMRWICLILVVVLMLSTIGCKKKSQQKSPVPVVNTEKFIGTWQGSDHDGEKVVHYLIFDDNGYWNILMNYPTLTRAIKQKAEQLVSFAVFCELQNSQHTGCFYEYVDDAGFAENFYINEDGCLVNAENDEVVFTRISTEYGEPTEAMRQEAADLFDRAREEALDIK